MVWFLLNRRTGEAGGAEFGSIKVLAKRRHYPIFPDPGRRNSNLSANRSDRQCRRSRNLR